MTAPDYAPRVPPHSHEAELSVLGSVMLEPETLDLEDVAALTPVMFYRESHRKIFAAMQRLKAEGTPPDLVTLTDALGTAGQLDEVGGVSYLIGLGDSTPTSAYAEHYARLVLEKWTLRELISQSAILSRQAYDAQLPLEDILAYASQIGANLDMQASSGMISMSDAVADFLQTLRSGNGEQPQPTGFSDLDDQLAGGLYNATLNILAARPSMGKTAAALSMGVNTAKNLLRTGDAGQVAVVSLEMPASQLIFRLAANEASVDAQLVRNVQLGKATLSERQWQRIDQKMQELAPLPMTYMDDSAVAGDIRTLPAKLRAAHKQKPLRLVIIDYLQLMNGAGNENRQQEVSNLSRKLKQLAREFNCPFLVLSQLSRAVEMRPNHRPMLSDLRESGGIEQDADVVMFIYRDEYYNKETDQQGIAEVIVGKQRNGPTGTIKLSFLNAFVRFGNLARE